MTNKKQEKENKLHIINVNNDDSLSAGICGPDGCVLDWSKADKGEKHEAYDQVVKIGKTLGNVSRLKILDNLVQSKKSVEELARAVGLSIGTTSKNLQLLKKVNLVKEEKEKNFVFYAIADQKVKQLLTLLIDISEENIPELKQLQKDLKKHNSNLISLSIPELRNKIKKEDIYIIDLRSKDEFDTGHLPGAHNIPFNKIDDEMNKLPRDREMVIYCRGRLCPYSDIVGNKLKMAGYNVQTFNNTVWEWQQAVEG